MPASPRSSSRCRRYLGHDRFGCRFWILGRQDRPADHDVVGAVFERLRHRHHLALRRRQEGRRRLLGRLQEPPRHRLHGAAVDALQLGLGERPDLARRVHLAVPAGLVAVDVADTGECMGVKQMQELIQEEFPNLRFGYFNPPMERIR